MRILMLNYEYPPLGGGAANANYYLLKEFADYDDLEIDLITSSPGDDDILSISDNISVHRLDVNKREKHHWTQREILSYSWKSLRKIRQLRRVHSYNLIHAWFGVPSGILAAMTDLPYIVALRGSDVPGYNERFSLQYKFLKPAIRKVWHDAEAVVANSEGLRDLARETSMIPIYVIPNGISTAEFEPRFEYAESEGRLEILCVSRLVRRKGIEYVLRSVAEVDNTTLTIVGTGERESQLKDLTSALNLEERVSFEGYVPHEEIHSYYEGADVFVLPSFNEGMSNTVLEAMAAGLPIVTTDTGGTDELVDRNGTVVPQGDPDAIASALRRYRDSPELCQRQGKRSRERADEMSWSSVAEQYHALYRRVVESDTA